MPKKKWQRPKLIVLVRGSREAGEYVLNGCKEEGYGGGDPAFIFRGCWEELVPESCRRCFTVSATTS